MKKSGSNIITLLFAFIIMFNLQGCSILGFGIGAVADKGKITVDQTVPQENIMFLEHGLNVEVVDKGGIIYRGAFERVEAIEVYNGELQRVVWLKSDGNLKPVLLDNIDRIVVPGKKKNAKWTGLCIGAVIDAVIITAVSVGIKNWERDREPVHICFSSSNCGHWP